MPTSADVVAILDRIARRLADEMRDDAVNEGVDVLAQVQAEGGGDLAFATKARLPDEARGSSVVAAVPAAAGRRCCAARRHAAAPLGA